MSKDRLGVVTRSKEKLSRAKQTISFKVVGNGRLIADIKCEET